ncbi:MAG: hypothetical protein ABI678_22810 [Kofleriaceae bacterium]
MRSSFAIFVGFVASCGGGGGNPDAAAHADAMRDSAPPDAPFCPVVQTIDPATAAEVTIAGDTPSLGVFDPSIIYPADAPGGAMVYSAVPTQETIRTHLALSPDHGATWTYVAELNTPQAMTIASSECTGGACTGNLISEVASLIIDPAEPDPAKRWKLFAHRYLVGPNVALYYKLGTITLQTAAQPQGPWTAPQKLIGWNGPSAYSSTGVTLNVTTAGGSASDCIALTEPAALVLPTSIDLAVGGVSPDGATLKIRIELLRSTDHGTSWSSAGTLLRADDAACSGLPPGLNGADLFVANGTEYVSATPSDATGYRGCMVFALDPADHVQRDGQDRAIVARAFGANEFSGACTFADGADGYAMDIGLFGDPRPFRMFRPGISAP